MTLEDLLETLRRDMLHDTSDRVSGDNDQLWSDTALIGYIDQAQRRFARRSLCIRDGSTAVTRFTTVPFQRDYLLDPSIITVASVRSMGNGRWISGVFLAGAPDPSTGAFVLSGRQPVYPTEHDLTRVGHGQRNRRFDDCSPWSQNATLGQGVGVAHSFETDETMGEQSGSAGVVSMRLHPMPDVSRAGCVMQMRVARMPLVRLTPQTMSEVPEIPEDYHVDMLDYAAYLALRVVDHEAGDPGRAQEFRQSFEGHVLEARREIERKQFQPTRWGFGGNGFTYDTN